MKYGLLLFVSFLSVYGFSQQIPTAPNQRNAEGKRVGEWVITYSKSRKETILRDSITFYRVIKFDKVGKPLGKTTDYYLSGKKQWEGTLLEMEPEEIMDGLVIWFYENGKEKDRAFFERGGRVDFEIMKFSLEKLLKMDSLELALLHLKRMNQPMLKAYGPFSREYFNTLWWAAKTNYTLKNYGDSYNYLNLLISLFFHDTINNFHQPRNKLVKRMNELNYYSNIMFALQFPQDERNDWCFNYLIKTKNIIREIEEDNFLYWDTINDSLRLGIRSHFSFIKKRMFQDSLKQLVNGLEKHIALNNILEQYSKKAEIKLSDIRAKLKPHHIAIELAEFHHFNDKKWTLIDTTYYAALLLRPEWKVPKMVRLFEKRQLEELLGKNVSRETLANTLYRGGGGVPDVSKKVSHELYKFVWQPLDSLLQGVQTIYYSPSGLLHQLNLSAIPFNDSLTLGEKYDMYRLGSTRQLAEENNFTTVSNHSLLLGNINFDADSVSITTANKNIKPQYNVEFETREDVNNGVNKWKHLTNTGPEISAIAKYSTNADKLIYNSATEDAFYAALAKKPKVIHLATHGFFYDAPKDTLSTKKNEPVFVNARDAMLRSGLILAGANRVWLGGIPKKGQEDGILTAYEVSLTDMRNTELVVTSACETALGDINGSEGVFGLQRAFKIAGAKNLLMSLWKVDDEATKEYMETFYKLYLKEGKTIHEAYQLTQSQMKKKYKNPYYWAAFILLE